MITSKINHQNLKQGLWWILSLQCLQYVLFWIQHYVNRWLLQLSFLVLLIVQNYWSIKIKKSNTFSLFPFPFLSWMRGKWPAEVVFSAQQMQTEEQHGGNMVPTCTIPLDVNDPYEYKVRLACSDYTWRAKLLLVMMMCICFSEGWIAPNGFCFQFSCLMWVTSGSWVLV